MGYRTNLTNNRREQLKQTLDDFATFMWRGTNMFEEFGVFIISEKQGDLKFYNGSSFSNEYTKTQFSSSSGELLGVSFNKQKISFKIGAYWFSISDWQDFLDFINAYEVNYLTFSFASKYSYLVKLAKISDSPRYIVGYEDNEPRYYTEMQLEWDLQGDSCVRSNSPYEWTWDSDDNTLTFFDPTKQEANPNSKLPTPLLLQIPFSGSNSPGSIKLLVSLEGVSDSTELFSVEFDNLPANSTTSTTSTDTDEYKDSLNTDTFYKQSSYDNNLLLQYDSETGVLLYKQGDVNWKLLHLNLVDSTGEYVVKSMTTKKYKLVQDISQYVFTIDTTNINISKPTLQIYERTNVI